MLTLKTDTQLSYWVGFVLSGIIPLFFGCVLIAGLLIAFMHVIEAYEIHDALGVIFFIYMGIAVIAGHHFVYKKIYSNLQRNMGHYPRFRTLFYDWVLQNSKWHILGILYLPFIFLLCLSIFLGEGSGTQHSSQLAEVAINLLVIFGSFFGLLFYLFLYGVVMFFTITLPVTLFSALIFRLFNLADV